MNACELPPLVPAPFDPLRAVHVPARGMASLAPEDWCAGPWAAPSVELHVLALERLSDVALELAGAVRAGVPGRLARLEAMTAAALRTGEALGFTGITGQAIGPEDCSLARGWALCVGHELGVVFGDVCSDPGREA